MLRSPELAFGCSSSSPKSPDDENDINDIVADLAAVVGGDVQLDAVHVVVRKRQITASGEVRWIYVSRE